MQHATRAQVGRCVIWRCRQRRCAGTAAAASAPVVQPNSASTPVKHLIVSDANRVTSAATGAASSDEELNTGWRRPAEGLEPVPPLAQRPGIRDDANFEQHWSVETWRRPVDWPPPGGNLTTLSGLQAVASALQHHAAKADLLRDTTSSTYWAYHMGRCAYFALQGWSSVMLQSLLTGNAQKSGFLGTQSVAQFTETAALRLPAEAMRAFEQDLRLAREGTYKLPWDMTTPGHRQSNPLFLVRQAGRYYREALRVLGARAEGSARRGAVPFGRTNLYPEYYQNNFHYQTDGWFSRDSARVYEVATESLFVGRQDAMQRATLVPLHRHVVGTNSGAGLRVLEVGAGTGRFATFLRDNYPRVDLTVTDLSPYYLEEARHNMAYWERRRGRAAGGLGKASFVQCAAEALPFESGSLDVVYSIYVFHEMPDEARRSALREAARVLRPGGLLVVTDSTQWGDRPGMDANLAAFERLNEPHYPSFVKFDFGEEMRAVGLRPDFKVLTSVTKAVSAVKPSHA